MTRDPIFCTLRSEALSEIASYLQWNPLVSDTPTTFLSQCSTEERLKWLHEHRLELESHISWVGTPIFSFAFGNARGYREIICDFAAQLGIPLQTTMETAGVEAAILQKLWSDALERLTPEQREALLSKARSLAEQYSPTIGKEMVGFAGLTAAQLSGFGVYMLGSTLLGAINSFLGLGLGFGAFTGLSSVIAVAIGPFGWAALGLYTIKKLGAANYRKLLPVILLVAMERAGKPILSRLIEGSAPTLPPTSIAVVPRSADAKIQPAKSEEPHLPKSAILARIYTKAEKTHFQLRPENRELCKLVEEFCPGRHFLDLLPDDQQFIRDYLNVTIEEKREVLRITESSAKEERKQRQRVEREAHSAKKQHRQFEAKVHKRSKAYSKLLRNLEFHPAALERLELVANSGASTQIDEKLGLMNAGHTVYRDSIEGTQPKIYETKAGWDYRIYFYRDGQRTCIRLIGDKGTQDADLEQLRRDAVGSRGRSA